MKKPRILVSIPQGKIRDSFFNSELAERLETLGEAAWNQKSTMLTEDEFAEKLKGIDICITGWGNTPLNENTLKYADSLKLIAHDGGTIRPMISDYAFEKGIRVCCGNRVFARSVAEGVVAYILAALRRIPAYYNQVQQGEWPSLAGTRGLLDRSVGLVGYGMISQYVAQMLKAFGCSVKVSSRYITEEELKREGLQLATTEEIFESCDIVSLHQGLTRETKGSIDEALLRKLKNGAVLVNTARGEIVDEQALIKVLKEGKITAVLDVFVEEPLPMNSPLRELDNVFLMPHAAGPTEDQRVAVTKHLLDDIECFLAGTPLFCEIDASRASKMTTVLKAVREDIKR